MIPEWNFVPEQELFYLEWKLELLVWEQKLILSQYHVYICKEIINN